MSSGARARCCPPPNSPATGGWSRWGFSGVCESAARRLGGSLYASLRRTGHPRHPRQRLDTAFDAARVDRAEIVAFVPPGAWLIPHDKLNETSRLA
ncbi:hypothetical protein P3L51_19250 [Streptomyces sp. PSRA5]|uniref:hypothetical protein n=1 Tax=Streptomyces panacea TaxID=3035064 RepID=UPI00339BA3EA